MNTRGRFLTLEGGEGAGKSSVLEALKRGFEKEGIPVLFTREPGGTPLGEEIRHLLLAPQQKYSVGPWAELFLFLSARAQHVEEVILPALEKGTWVLCDRFSDSTIAYQGYARGLGWERVQELCSASTGGLVPDLTLYLDVDPKEGLQRSRGVEKKEAEGQEWDRLEQEALQFHEKVREGFLLLAEREKRIQVIDANQSLERCIEQSWKVVKE